MDRSLLLSRKEARLINQAIEGIVLENHGALFDVLVGERVIRCALRGKLKKDKRNQVAPVAAGDHVEITLLEENRGIIERVFPRETDLSRRAAGAIPLQQTMVANVDQAVIVFAAAEPRPDFFFLDRFLVMAITAGIAQAICINKVDLADTESLRADLTAYSKMGHQPLFTSAVSNEGLAELQTLLKDRRSVICGPSGVGKSSLLNALAPNLSLRTGEIGNVTHKGRHTTSGITFLPLPFGGWIADTPGLRQLGFWKVAPHHLTEAFPDIAPYLGKCHYSNCTHSREQGCALLGAVKTGTIQARRLKSFLQMGGK